MTQATSHAGTSGPANSSTSKPRAPSAQQERQALTETADQAVQSVGALYKEVNTIVERQARQSPYATLGLAAGIGFVIGGGLASPLGQTLLRLSVRTFGPPLVNAALSGALERGNSNLKSG
jgi:ElaB/YqjD/DUF883 family membrane-anchored ribosome-binding protein